MCHYTPKVKFGVGMSDLVFTARKDALRRARVDLFLFWRDHGRPRTVDDLLKGKSTTFVNTDINTIFSLLIQLFFLPIAVNKNSKPPKATSAAPAAPSSKAEHSNANMLISGDTKVAVCGKWYYC